LESDPADSEAARTFGLERDLQNALRANIQQLEEGLDIVDGGAEVKVEAGFIDILAKDRNGTWVVIELKAELTRPAAVAQILAYMGCVASQRGGNVRGILVGADFDQRVEFAVRAVPNLSLKRYRFKFEFV
jgi:RecB family endonuclease NucS